MEACRFAGKASRASLDELLKSEASGMELPAVLVFVEDGLSGLVQPVAGDLDGLETRIVANVDHVLPALSNRQPSARDSGQASSTSSRRIFCGNRKPAGSFVGGSGHDRAPRVVVSGGGSATYPFKRGKEGEPLLFSFS